MSRRDTIIIAVLINAGLLLILFATAISTSSEEESSPPSSIAQIVSTEEAIPLAKDSLPTVPGDEVDQVLSQWNSKPITSESSRSRDGLQQTASESLSLGYRSSANEEAISSQPVKKPGETTTVQPIANSEAYKTVIVKKGDILDRIAKANGTTAEEIMKLNDLSSSQLKIGQSLQVPMKNNVSKPSVVKKEASANAAATAAQYYTVKSGDNPWLIAKKNQMALDELLKLNDLDEGKARRLKPGDKLRIK